MVKTVNNFLLVCGVCTMEVVGFVPFESSSQRVQKIPFKNIRAGGKVQLQNSIENPMRIDKTTHSLHSMRPDLVMRLNRLETIVKHSSPRLEPGHSSREK